ncbi:hypothetical protein [Candidatus Paracaedibacter symbiosus]|uniref:hypothetical protein n=1 Tax=Candidatus Paracaedibacter symbiosus TaxID=244582 RepID=UPI000509C491|nr:hypothetical protein [Candidatus Paracaedibacter symbiosus]
MSKELDSILKNIPSATVTGELKVAKENTFFSQKEEHDRIVAVVPRTLKNEIKEYIRKNPGETEKTVILKALKLLGFTIPNNWLVDKRSLR